MTAKIQVKRKWRFSFRFAEIHVIRHIVIGFHVVFYFRYVAGIGKRALAVGLDILYSVINREIVCSQVFHKIVPVEWSCQQFRTVWFRNCQVDQEHKNWRRKIIRNDFAWRFGRLVYFDRQDDQDDRIDKVKASVGLISENALSPSWPPFVLACIMTGIVIKSLKNL